MASEKSAGPLVAAPQQVPGFAITFVDVAVTALLLFAHGTQHEARTFGFENDGGGDDVPDIFAHDVGGEEIDFASCVLPCAFLVGPESALVSVRNSVAGRLDLHAKELSSVLDANVVRGRISPGARDPEVIAHGAGHESQFHPLAALFEISEALALRHCPAPRFAKRKGAAHGPRLVFLKF
jgi:hypothetical protein